MLTMDCLNSGHCCPVRFELQSLMFRITAKTLTNMSSQATINYLEIPASDLERNKRFFREAFDWQFTDYGPDYCAFDASAGLDGGFYRSELTATTERGSVLVVFHSHDLAATEQKITAAGGTISQPVFEFPGGRRFHFLDPCGNEFAVWSA
jgi:predicted enzyme related to lactoylglutathione lyase